VEGRCEPGRRGSPRDQQRRGRRAAARGGRDTAATGIRRVRQDRRRGAVRVYEEQRAARYAEAGVHRSGQSAGALAGAALGRAVPGRLPQRRAGPDPRRRLPGAWRAAPAVRPAHRDADGHRLPGGDPRRAGRPAARRGRHRSRSLAASRRCTSSWPRAASASSWGSPPSARSPACRRMPRAPACRCRSWPRRSPAARSACRPSHDRGGRMKAPPEGSFEPCSPSGQEHP